MTSVRSCISAVVLMTGMLSAPPVLADTTMSFHGSLVIPDCVLNDNSDIVVDFGNVDIEMLSESNTLYELKTLSVPLECPYTQGIPKLKLTAIVPPSSQAKDGVISTSKDNEGLVIYLRKQDGITPVPLNSATGTDISDSISGNGTSRILNLVAGLGQINGVGELTAGGFNASVNLQVCYE